MAFPKMLFSAAGLSRLVTTQAEQDALAKTWQENPSNWGLVTAPSSAQITANTAAVSTLFPNGRQLTADTVRSTDVRVRAPTLGF